MADNPSAARFPTTNWSRVAAAGDRASPEDREALAELCRAYSYPQYFTCGAIKPTSPPRRGQGRARNRGGWR
jgi:hypothetical protein